MLARMDPVTRHDTPAFTRIRLGGHAFALPDAFALAFDTASFSEADFVRHGIVRPASIVRSVPKRQAEFLAGRRAALAALREVGGRVDDLPIGADRAPVWPTGFIGSLSHARDIAIAVALPDASGVRGIGIDVERIVLPEHMASIRSVAIDDDENAVLAALAATHGWPYALTLAFSAKESFYKATAATVGHFFDFAALRIVGCDAASATMETRVAVTLAPSLPAGQSHALHWVDIGPDAVLTSCAW